MPTETEVKPLALAQAAGADAPAIAVEPDPDMPNEPPYAIDCAGLPIKQFSIVHVVDPPDQNAEHMPPSFSLVYITGTAWKTVDDESKPVRADGTRLQKWVKVVTCRRLASGRYAGKGSGTILDFQTNRDEIMVNIDPSNPRIARFRVLDQ